ncbi:MAG: nitroreductase family protein [Candidatus Zixiibacteriota bacterium]
MYHVSQTDIDTIETFLNSHYSVREFTAEDVPGDMLARIVRISRRSPTSSNLQMCSVVTVRDENSKKRLSELCGNQSHIMQAPVFFVFLADLNPLASLCLSRGYPFKGEFLEPFVLATVDAALCAGRALIGAQAIGLSGVLVGGIRDHPREVAEHLELPEYCYAVCGMSVGHATKDGKVKPRLPDRGMWHHEKYRRDIFAPAAEEYDERIAQTDLYRNRRAPLPDGFEERGEAYSWSEHSARRLSSDDPLTLRVSLRPFLEEIGFKFK